MTMRTVLRIGLRRDLSDWGIKLKAKNHLKSINHRVNIHP